MIWSVSRTVFKIIYCPLVILGCDGPQVQLRGATRSPRSGAAAKRSYPTPEVRGGGREEQPYIQGVVAAWVQEGLEELLHVQGQEGWP